MADLPGQELPYGHFGLPIYDSHERVWTFSRDLLYSPNYQCFSGPETLLEAQDLEPFTAGQTENSLPTARRYLKQIRKLVHASPEIQAATGILPTFLRASEAVTVASGVHESSRGSLLAFGSIPSEKQHVPILVSASTSGICSQKLWLVERQLERRGWGDTRYAWIEVPSIGRRKAFWYSKSGPIQQICFSQTFDRLGTTIDSPSFMAARCMTATTVFRPIFRGNHEDDPERPYATLDLSPVFSVSIGETNDQMHADVAFNPWYVRQFAIISVTGDWTIWDPGVRRARTRAYPGDGGATSNYRVTLTGDAWVRIMWICNPTTILICTRNLLELFDITNEEHIKVASVDFASSSAASCILDIALLPNRPTFLCVLTSTHLHILHMQQMIGNAIESVQVTALLKLTHFWNQDDMNLKISLSVVDEQDTLILLHSANTSAILSFRISITKDSCTLITDPCMINFAPASRDKSRAVGIEVTRIYTSGRGQRWSSSISESFVTQLRQTHVDLFTLTALYSDGKVTQSLLADHTRASTKVRLTPPTWTASRPLASAVELKKASFVISDSDEREDSVKIGKQRRPLSIERRQLLNSQSAQVNGYQGTLNYDRVCRVIDCQQVDHGESVERTLDRAISMLQGTDMSDTVSWKTLLELSPTDIVSVNNTVLLSARLDGLTHIEPTKSSGAGPETSDGESIRLRVQTLACSYSLQGMYQRMIDDWISPLSTRVSGRLRISKDGLLRTAAAEVALASRLLRPEPTEDVADGENDDGPPIIGDISQRTLNSLSQQDSGLPTPSLTTTPSVSTSHASTIETSVEMVRLGRYTSFTPQAPSTHMLGPLPRSLVDILSHWSLGTDPQDYDWIEASQRVIQQRYQEDEEGMGEKERKYARKKVERHIKRQRREAEEMERNRVNSSQATMVMSNQLPARTKGSEGSRPTAGSSQVRSQSEMELVTASQIVPGRFGGRPDQTPKKRKRKQGF